jgi:hypothetical protein
MRSFTTLAMLLAVITLFPQIAVFAADAPPPIEKVEIRDRAFHVNGEPFFPIMAWLQDADNFPILKRCGMNTTAGYWSGSSGTKDVAEYLGLVERAGLYGVMPYSEKLRGHPMLLGYIHGDEPDLPRQVSDAEVVPSPELRINRSTPLWRLVDGVTHTWSVLDPLEGAKVTIRRKEPATAASVALHLTVSPGLAVARQVTFQADGKPILTATLEAKRGRQQFALEKPANFKELTFVVDSTYPGDHVWGSLGEVEAFDAEGKNVLLAPPRQEPRKLPEATWEEYRAIKAADPSRPVFMTLTGNFHPHFNKFSAAQREALYPAYIRATDVVGYDIYPIYGWNKPEWLWLVHDATKLLTEMAGSRPVYAWIETSKGGQWTGDLERQKDVTPAHIRAQVWMSICRGATAIGYFTHVWKPSYKQFGVPEENQRELRRTNEQIARLAPAILSAAPSPRVRIAAVEGDVKLDAIARSHGGDLYLFAVNYDERAMPARATIEVEGLPAGAEVEVIDESRTLRAAAGALGDDFEPLGVHVYRVKGLGGRRR